MGYSGGIETSAAIARLAERAASNTEVVAVILDLGRREELVEQRERALTLGAVRCHVVDSREDLVRRYILPALQAGAFDDARGWMPSAIARPLIAKTIVDIARMEAADTVVYGGSAMSRGSLDALVRSLNPSLRTLAPSDVCEMSKSAVLEYARARDIPATVGSDWQKVSANLWGRSVALDRVQDPPTGVPDDTYVLTRSADECPNRPAYVELEFEAGVPSRVNGIEMPIVEMIESLEIIGGTHGVGRTDTPAGSGDGTACREIGEAPAAALLQLAQRELRSLRLAPDVAARVEESGRAYAQLIQSGAWFSPARQTIDAFISSLQPALSGSIRLRLFKGDCTVSTLVAS
jgi:argininosuccinate synthase